MKIGWFPDRRAILAAIPIIGVNVTAFIGQLFAIRDQSHWPLPGDIFLAATLESVAVYLASEAHDAMRKGDSSFGLRIAAQSFAFIIAGLNYWHWSGPGFRPTFLAVATGLMSASSPWLWGIFSSRRGRETLKALGLIESRSVKFSRARWAMYPVKTFGAFRLAVWNGVTEPSVAIADYEEYREIKQARPVAETLSLEPTTIEDKLANAESKAEAIRHAIDHLGEETKNAVIVEYLANAETPWDVSEARIRQVRAGMRNAFTQS